MLDPSTNSRDAALLDPDFAAKLDQLIYNCAAREAEFVVDCTVRGPVVQARLWCSSRTLLEIAAARDKLITSGAPKLAALLLDSYTGSAHCVTHALPGEGYHEYLTAADLFLEVNGAAVWSSPLYLSVLADEAQKLGLTAGALWQKPKTDLDHIQASAYGSPLDEPGASWASVEQRMVELYGL